MVRKSNGEIQEISGGILSGITAGIVGILAKRFTGVADSWQRVIDRPKIESAGLLGAQQGRGLLISFQFDMTLSVTMSNQANADESEGKQLHTVLVNFQLFL